MPLYKYQSTLAMMAVFVFVILGSIFLAKAQSYDPVQVVDWSSTGQIAVGYYYGTIQILNNDEELLETLTTPSMILSELAWSPTGDKLAFANPVGEVWIWDAATDMIASLEQPDEFVSALAWSPDGTQIAIAVQSGTGPTARNGVNIWNINTGELVRRINPNSQEFYINSVAWNPVDTHQIVTGSFTGRVYVWDTETGELLENSLTLQRIDPNRNPDLADIPPNVTSVNWRADGARLAAATNDGTVFVWDTTTELWQLIAVSIGGSVSQVSWNSNNQLAAVDGDEIRILDPDHQQSLCTIMSEDFINALAWSPDSNQIIYGSDYSGNYEIVSVVTPDCAE